MSFNVKQSLSPALILLAVLLCHFPTATAHDMPTEQSVRAAMVFNFLRFAEFPPEGIAKPAAIRLCLAVQDEQQAGALAALSGRKVRGRTLIVAEFTAQSSDCDVFYVDSPRRWNMAEEHRALRHALTISDYPGFVRDGGMVEIDVQRDGARFDINLAAVRSTGFHFAPQMLRLARQIHE